MTFAMMSSITVGDISLNLQTGQCGEDQISGLITILTKTIPFVIKYYCAIISDNSANRKQEPHKKYQKYDTRIIDQVSQAEPAATQKYFAYPKTSPQQSLNEYDGLKNIYQIVKKINTKDTEEGSNKDIDVIRCTSLGSTDKAAPSHPEDVGLGKSAEEDATTSKDHTEDVQTESADDQMPSSSKAPKDTECSGGAYHDGDAAPASASELPVSEMGSRGDARTSPMQFRQNASTTLTEINPPGMTREENATPMDSKSSLKQKSSYSATPPLSSSVCSVNDQPSAEMPDVNSEEAYSKWSQMTGAVENDGLSASVPPSSLQTDLKGIPSMITPEHCKMTLTEQSRCDKETTHLEKHATLTPAGETRSSKTSVPVLTTPSNTETQVKDNGLLVESRKSVSQTPMDDCATFSALDKDSNKLLFQRPGTGNNKTLPTPEENSDAGLKQNCDGDATEVKSAVTTKELTIPKEPPPQNQTNDDQQIQVLRKTSQGLVRVNIVLSAKDDAYFEGEYSKAMSLKHVACASILASDFYYRVQQAFPFQQFNGRERSRWEFWRLSTFAPLDNFPVSPIRLAQSGFYYDEVLDDIICFSCGLRKRQWDITEKSVAVKHLELSEGNCAQANFQDERNVPIDSARFPRVSSPANTEHPQRRADSSQGRGESLSTDVSDARGFSEAPSSSSSCPPSLETAEHRAAVTGERHSHVGDLPPAPGKTHADRVMSPQGRNNQQERGYAEVNGNALRTNVSSPVESGSNSLARHTQQTSSQATATNTQNGIASPPSDRPEQNSIAGTSPPLDRPQQNSIAGTSPPSDIPQQNSIADTSPPSDRPQQNSIAGTSPPSDIPQQNSIADTLPLTHPPQQNGIADKSPPSDRPQQNSIADTSPPSDRPQKNSGTTYSLPPPLPRTEEIEKHRRLAAHSAGRAQCQSSLLPLSSSNRESDTPGRISVSATTSQAPSAFNTPATTELRHYPVQDEQGPNLTPDQISAFVPPRGDGLANGSTRRNGDGADGDESAINGLDMTRAVSPGNASASARLASFTDWPTRGLPSPRLLVIAGFYYLGAGDSVRCFYCGVTLRNWRQTDDPWETHVRFRFSCDYVIFIKGDDFVLQTSLKIANRQNFAVTNGGDSSDAPSSTTDPNGASEGARVSVVSSSAASNATTSGREGQRETSGEGASSAATNPANGSEACNGTALLPSQELRGDGEGSGASNRTDRQTTTTARSHATQQAVTSGSRSTTRQTTVSREHPAPRSTTRTVDNRDEVTYLQRLQEANRRLRQRQTCRLCGDRAVDTIFLPCGHLCTCESCAATIRECCLCHDRIRGTAHVYLE